MSKLTEKENFMMMFDGKIPEWIPRLILAPVKDLEEVPEEVKDSLEIIPVKKITEVLEGCKLV